jgi:hypothetical protein
MKNPDLIEDGLTYLDHHVRTGEQVRIDFLFADANGVLVIAELNVEETEDILLGCLEYYDEIVTNIEGYARLFGEKFGIKISSNKKPRMMIIAPSFGAKFIEKCRWLRMSVSAFTFKCIKPRYSEFVLPVFSSVHIPIVPRNMESEAAEPASGDESESAESEVAPSESFKGRDYKIYFGNEQGEDAQKIEFEESVEKLETEYDPQQSD